MATSHEIAAVISARWDELARDGKVNRDATIDSIVTQMMQEKIIRGPDISTGLPEFKSFGEALKNCGGRLDDLPQYPTWADLQKAVEKLVAEKNIAVDNLTREQFAEAITQAIQCGDFTRYVVRDDDRQHVGYIPFRREQELLAQIASLRRALIANTPAVDDPSFYGDSFGGDRA